MSHPCWHGTRARRCMTPAARCSLADMGHAGDHGTNHASAEPMHKTAPKEADCYLIHYFIQDGLPGHLPQNTEPKKTSFLSLPRFQLLGRRDRDRFSRPRRSPPPRAGLPDRHQKHRASTEASRGIRCSAVRAGSREYRTASGAAGRCRLRALQRDESAGAPRAAARR